MSTVDDVKQKIDIVDVIGQYVTLRKAGRNFKALCPFHNEKTPSFIVFPDQGRWHCFGSCGTGGDVFSFLMKKENIDFGEALRRLAQRAGVELTHERGGDDAERKKLREILAAASARYHYWLRNLPAAQFAREYLTRRFITPDTAASFELGYAPHEWDALKGYLVGKGFTVQDLVAAGLVSQGERGSYYDRFRNRLMFPIRNRNGEVIGFGARTLSGDEPKYLNSPQTVLFDKSATLYGLDYAKDAIRSQNLAIIVEGYMDVIGAHQAGFKNVVASLGTALTEKQLALLKRLTKRYALALDPDAAGEEATKRGLQVAREALDRKTVPVPMGAGLIGFEERLEAELLVIPMPPGQDPDELIHENPARWVELVEHAEPLVDFNFRVLTQDLDFKSARDKSAAVRRLVPIIQEIGDAVQREHYTQKLARLVQVPEQTLAQEFTRRPASPSVNRQPETPAASATASATTAAYTGSKLEEYCLALVLNTPELLSRIEFLEGQEFTDVGNRMLFLLLREAEQAVRPGQLDREAFRSGLTDLLVPVWDRLVDAAAKLPVLDEADLARELEKAALSLQITYDRNELGRIQVLLRDADDERTPEEERALRERVAILGKRILDNQKAQSARGLFKPRLVL